MPSGPAFLVDDRNGEPSRASYRGSAVRLLHALARPDGGRLAAILYCCMALPIVVFAAFGVAPGQVPDEPHHFLRAVQLAQGQVIGTRFSERDAGGVVPGAVDEVLLAFDGLKLRDDRKVDPAVLQAVRKLKWDDLPLRPTPFITVLYPPFMYVGTVTAILVGRASGYGVLDTFYLARFVNGVVAVSLAAAAVALAARARALLAAILLLPGTLALFGSCSQDALLISSVALATGLCSRAIHSAEALSDRQRLLVAALLGAAVAARPPYLPLLTILACGPLRLRSLAGRAGIVGALPLVLAACAVPPVWIALVAPLKVPFGEASPADQIAFLREHPAALIVAAYHSFSRIGHLYFEGFIGILGWFDTYFPRAYYAWGGIVLACAALASMFGRGPSLRGPERLAVTLAALTVFVGLYAVSYLTWSPVRSDWIDGVMGRYFVPIACMAALTARGPKRDTREEGFPALAVAVGWTVLILFGLSNLFMVPWVLVTRYYG
jgi:hypothetical protein